MHAEEGLSEAKEIPKEREEPKWLRKNTRPPFRHIKIQLASPLIFRFFTSTSVVAMTLKMELD